MPPKDHIDLDAGTIYYAREDETPVPLDGIQEVTLEPAEGGLVEQPAIVIGAELAGEASITLSIDEQYEALQELYLKPMREAWRQTLQGARKCHPSFWAFLTYLRNGYFPNPRLSYLAAHGKNRRIRKKNIQRLLRGD